jgi:hypothetical protein
MEIFPQSEKSIDLCLPNLIGAAGATTGELFVLNTDVRGGETGASKGYACAAFIAVS